MMGYGDPQKQLWCYQVNLDKRVRSNHPLRRINETLELDFVRREVAQFYGTKGNVSEDPVVTVSRVVVQWVRGGLGEGTKIHADSSLVDANGSLNSVHELDAATLNQIRQACREQTEKLDEADTKKNEADDDQDPGMPRPGPRTKINQKYQSNTDPEATLVRQHGFKTRPRYKNHRVADDPHAVITAVHTTTGRINESHELM